MNGEIIKKIVKNKMDNWKVGKFVPLTSRTLSVNTYCLSKLWYRTSSIDILIGDCKNMTSSVKSWIYQPMIRKPYENLLYRTCQGGGLGMFNIYFRAQANLVRKNLRTASNKSSALYIYHNSLFKYFIGECLRNLGSIYFLNEKILNCLKKWWEELK